jgi:hypothetical protein
MSPALPARTTFPHITQCSVFQIQNSIHPTTTNPAGRLWAHEVYGVEPDLMTLAKPLAGGLPIGAMLVKQHVADVMKPGE